MCACDPVSVDSSGVTRALDSGELAGSTVSVSVLDAAAADAAEAICSKRLAQSQVLAVFTAAAEGDRPYPLDLSKYGGRSVFVTVISATGEVVGSALYAVEESETATEIEVDTAVP